MVTTRATGKKATAAGGSSRSPSGSPPRPPKRKPDKSPAPKKKKGAKKAAASKKKKKTTASKKKRSSSKSESPEKDELDPASPPADPNVLSSDDEEYTPPSARSSQPVAPWHQYNRQAVVTPDRSTYLSQEPKPKTKGKGKAGAGDPASPSPTTRANRRIAATAHAMDESPLANRTTSNLPAADVADDPEALWMGSPLSDNAIWDIFAAVGDADAQQEAVEAYDHFVTRDMPYPPPNSLEPMWRQPRFGEPSMLPGPPGVFGPGGPLPGAPAPLGFDRAPSRVGDNPFAPRAPRPSVARAAGSPRNTRFGPPVQPNSSGPRRSSRRRSSVQRYGSSPQNPRPQVRLPAAGPSPFAALGAAPGGLGAAERAAATGDFARANNNGFLGDFNDGILFPEVTELMGFARTRSTPPVTALTRPAQNNNAAAERRAENRRAIEQEEARLRRVTQMLESYDDWHDLQGILHPAPAAVRRASGGRHATTPPSAGEGPSRSRNLRMRQRSEDVVRPHNPTRSMSRSRQATPPTRASPGSNSPLTPRQMQYEMQRLLDRAVVDPARVREIRERRRAARRDRRTGTPDDDVSGSSGRGRSRRSRRS